MFSNPKATYSVRFWRFCFQIGENIPFPLHLFPCCLFCSFRFSPNLPGRIFNRADLSTNHQTISRNPSENRRVIFHPATFCASLQCWPWERFYARIQRQTGSLWGKCRIGNLFVQRPFPIQRTRVPFDKRRLLLLRQLFRLLWLVIRRGHAAWRLVREQRDEWSRRVRRLRHSYLHSCSAPNQLVTVCSAFSTKNACPIDHSLETATDKAVKLTELTEFYTFWKYWTRKFGIIL